MDQVLIYVDRKYIFVDCRGLFKNKYSVMKGLRIVSLED